MTPDQEFAVLIGAAIVLWLVLLVMVIRGEAAHERQERSGER